MNQLMNVCYKAERDIVVRDIDECDIAERDGSVSFTT